jgi:predicted PurR-regulated permease PerM
LPVHYGYLGITTLVGVFIASLNFALLWALGVVVGLLVINFLAESIFKPKILKRGVELPAAVPRERGERCCGG